MSTQTDVIIAGAGPVGLTLALALARQNITVTVLEREPQLSASPRAMVYLHPLLHDLDELGILDGMLARGIRDDEGLNLHNAATGEVVSVPNDALQGVDPYPFNVNLGQGEYCAIVLELLSAYPTATVVMGAEVLGASEGSDEATLLYRHDGDVKQLTARYAVGADGGHSVLRESIGATLEGFTWDERFVATNVRFDFRSRGFKTSNMFIDPEIGCIVAQITPDGLWRCTFQEDLSLPEETVAERIPAHFDRLLGPDAGVELVDFRPYRMHQRLSSALRKGRIILAGDAAHLTNPTGGLGLTTGLYDVFLLQEVLGAIINDGADDELLDEYAAERSRVFREVSSPNATHFKKLVYDSRDLDALDQQLDGFRQAAATLESQRAFLNGLDMVRSPSIASQRA